MEDRIIQIIYKAMKIPGWMNESELSILCKLVGSLPSESKVIEIGTYDGRSLCCMAAISPKNIFYGIDKFLDEPCDDWPEDKRHLSWPEFLSGPKVPDGYESPDMERTQKNIDIFELTNVTLLKGDSDSFHEMFEDKSIDMIFIDSSHDYATVKRTLKLYLPKMKTKSIISGHDYDCSWPGVCKAVDEVIEHLSTAKGGSMWWTIKGEVN